MAHKISGRRLRRTSSHLKAMKRNMVTSLIMNGRINTTVQKAKEIRIVAEKLVTLAKKGSLQAKRQVLEVVRGDEAMRKLFDDYANRFAQRQGGYTRIIKNGFRAGDNAEMALIEFLSTEKKEEEKPAEKKTKKTAAAAKKKTAGKKSEKKEVVTGEEKAAPKRTRKKSEEAKPAAEKKAKVTHKKAEHKKVEEKKEE